MEHVAFLPELVLILGAGVAAAVAVAFLRLPAVAGFMLAGAVVGPSGFGLVKEQHVVDAPRDRRRAFSRRHRSK